MVLLYRIAPFEYTDIKGQQDWIFAIKLIYKNMLQEYRLLIFQNSKKSCIISREEYLICEFSCVLSSVGGYVGLFFGVSVLDFVFLGEWVVGKFTGVIQKYNKNI